MGGNGVHVPVLRERVVSLLQPALADGGLFIDATLGLGGHAEAVLAAAPRATLLGLDRDPMALRLAQERLGRFAERVHTVHTNYDRLPEALDSTAGLPAVRAVLFDLGVSSLQLDVPERGFSYLHDAPLDMRMDGSRDADQPTAADVVATYSVDRIAEVLRSYGEERFALRIAKAIDRARQRSALRTTGELVEVIRQAVPTAAAQRGHPAKRTFQALRIEVNGELDALAVALPAALAALVVGGRIVVLAYHSLEDRLVKRTFAALASDATPAGLPVVLPGHGPQLRLLVRGEPATAAEVGVNSRASSARLRAAERIRSAA